MSAAIIHLHAFHCWGAQGSPPLWEPNTLNPHHLTSYQPYWRRPSTHLRLVTLLHCKGWSSLCLPLTPCSSGPDSCSHFQEQSWWPSASSYASSCRISFCQAPHRCPGWWKMCQHCSSCCLLWSIDRQDADYFQTCRRNPRRTLALSNVLTFFWRAKELVCGN